MTDTNHGHDSRAKEHHGLAIFIMVFVALCLLTSASVFTYTDFWRQRVPVQIGWTFMMAVSCTKALLVVSFFMHLKWEANWKYVLTIPATIMSIFLILMLVPDVGLRTTNYSVYRQVHAPVADSQHEEQDHSDSTVRGGHKGSAEAR
jgi:cytochrome c oxidase subunit 4